MLPLIPAFLLFFTSLTLVVLHRIRRSFAYSWLVASLGAVLSWGSVLLSLGLIPWEPAQGAWEPRAIFGTSIRFLLDDIGWSYGLALATLALAVILTDVARATEDMWTSWAGSLALGALGLLAVVSGNIFTLMLAWAAIDLAELVLLLRWVTDRRGSERVVVAFSARALGYILVLWAGILEQTTVSLQVGDSQSPQVGFVLLIAAGLRLGVLPLHLPLLGEPPLRRGLGTMLRLVPVAASLLLLARTATPGLSPEVVRVLVGFTLFAGLYGAAGWILAGSELDGRPFWIVGMASLSLVAALLDRHIASLAWGTGLILSGGALFLSSARRRSFLWILLGAIWAFSGLPYSPSWTGVRIYLDASNPLVFGYLLVHAGMVVGFARQAMREGVSMESPERWVLLIYPLGLALLPIASIVIAWWPSVGLNATAEIARPWWPGGLVGILAALLWIGSQRMGQSTEYIGPLVRRFFSLDWFYRLLWRLYRWIGQTISLLTALLEGEGGVLWALLLLTLLISLIVQMNIGGDPNGF